MAKTKTKVKTIPVVSHTPGPWGINDSGFGVYYVNPKIEAGDEAIDDPSHDSVVADTNGMGPWSGIPDDVRQANANLISCAPDADRILRHLLEYVEAAEPIIHFDGLMPDDGYDGATDEQTLAGAIRAYFAKVRPR